MCYGDEDTSLTPQSATIRRLVSPEIFLLQNKRVCRLVTALAMGEFEELRESLTDKDREKLDQVRAQAHPGWTKPTGRVARTGICALPFYNCALTDFMNDFASYGWRLIGHEHASACFGTSA